LGSLPVGIADASTTTEADGGLSESTASDAGFDWGMISVLLTKPSPTEIAAVAAEQSPLDPTNHAVKFGPMNVSGRLSPPVIWYRLRQRLGDFDACAAREKGGTVLVTFVVERDGTVVNISASDTQIAKSTVLCISRLIAHTTFDKPEGGVATVTVPLIISRDSSP